MKNVIVCLSIFLLICTIVFAQNAMPPRGKATINKLASIDYGRPSLKGRSIDEMFQKLPADRVWRAGNNQVTILTTEQDLLVGKTKIPFGKYSVYVHIGEGGEWSLILNRDLGNDLVNLFPKAPPQMAHEKWPYYTNYAEKIGGQEVARVPMRSEKLSVPVDMFTIELIPNQNSCVLKMSWGDRAASIDITSAK